ncbi:MAG TPA: hypothetical protein PK156_03410 [Polyangium sp.]|nr:hypothetical protein [Polyangium sp.]
MNRSKWVRSRWFASTITIVVVLVIALLPRRDAASETMPADGAPSGMVAFVAGGVCPPGWVHSYEVEGRVFVGTVDDDEIGETVGMAYTDREERAHHHDYAGTIDLPKKNIAGANGGNESGAEWGAYEIMGTTGDTSSALPFVQMEGCVKP